MAKMIRKNPKIDPEWMQFDRMLLNETGSYYDAERYASLTGFIEYCDHANDIELKKKHCDDWIMMTSKWMELEHRSGDPPLFVGVSMFVGLLPFNSMIDNDKFSPTELGYINWFRSYYDLELIKWKRAPQNDYRMEMYPLYPPAFEEWMNNNHNKSTWWINYCAYERFKGMMSLLGNPNEFVIEN